MIVVAARGVPLTYRRWRAAHRLYTTGHDVHCLAACFARPSPAAAGCSWVAAADHEGEHGLESVAWPWSHEGMLDSYDHGAIRRGFQVYQQVGQQGAHQQGRGAGAGGEPGAAASSKQHQAAAARLPTIEVHC